MPRFTVYSSDGKYVAECKYVEDAAKVVASYIRGTIRLGHSRIVWREGSESNTAGNSYDAVAQTIAERIKGV